MKNSTTRLKEAPTMRSGLPLIILLLVLVIGLSACTIHNGDGADQPPRFFDSISNRPFMSMRKQTDALITELLSYMENQVGWHGKAPNDEEYAVAMEDLRKEGEALCQK